MASLYNNKISTTYVGLIKTIDNAVISASLRELSDGSGNATGLYVNTAGDFKVTSILEFGSLKDTGEGITITKFVDEADGIASNDNDTTIPTSAAIKDYVDTKFAETDTLAEVLVFGNTTGVTKISVDSSSSGIDLVDDAKIRLGTGNDFSIYHDSATSKSIISESGASNLEIQAGNLIVKDTSDNTLSAFYAGGKNEFYFNSSKKLETTSDGATVTGGLTATGTSVFTAATFSGTITGDVTGNLTGNVAGDLTGNVTATSVLADGVTATTQSASDNSTKVATTAYVETAVDTVDTLAEILVIGNTTGATKIEVDNTSSGVDFIDNAKARFGTGNDLEIYHNGSNSYIQDSGTGELRVLASTLSIRNSGDTELMITALENGAVNLYYDNSKKFETSSTGATVTGNLGIGASASYNLDIEDAAGSVLQLSDGAGRYLRLRSANNGAQSVNISSYSGLALGGSDNSAHVTINSSGNTQFFGNIILGDNKKATFGDGTDLEIYHDGSNSYIDDAGTGWLNIRGSAIGIDKYTGETMATFVADGAVSLYYDNSLKFESTNTGATVTGNLDVTGTITGVGGSFLPLAGGTMTGNTIHNDNVKSLYGTSSDLEIYHDGSDSYIDETGTGDLIIQGSYLTLKANGSNAIIAHDNGTVYLYYSGGTKLQTSSAGATVTGTLSTTGSVAIADAGQLQLGSSNDMQVFHNSAQGYIRSNTGALNIDQQAVTESVIFRTSNASSLDVTALTITANGDLSTGRDVTIAGDLTVNGTTTTVNTDHFNVEDPLISMAKDNAANSVDIGYYGRYNDGTQRYLGLFSDASDSNTWKLFKGLTVEPTTTVDTTATGYALADLDVANLNSNSTIGTAKIQMQSDGTLDWGAAKDYGTLTWSGSYAYITGQSGKGLILQTNAGVSALTLDTSQNATFAGNVTVGNSGNINIPTAASGNANINFDGTDFKITSNSSSANLKLETSSTTRLTIDSSGNATFAGTIDSGAITSTGIVSATSYFLGTASEISLATTGAGNIFLRPNGQSTSGQMKLESSGNSTFAGNVTSPNFIVSDGTDNYIQFAVNGKNSHFTNTSNSFIWSGQGASGDYLAGTLNFQSRSNENRDINFITGATPVKRLTISGTGNANFTGSVTANTGSKITSSSADTTLSIETTTGTTIFPILDFVSSHSTVGGQIRQGGTKVIGFDKSLNSTFAGFLSAKKLTSTDGILELDDNGTHNGIINVPASLRINIDSDDGSTGESFQVGHNATNIDGNNILFKVEESGNVGIGVVGTPATKLHLGGTAPLDSIIRQDSTVSGTNWEIGERAAGKWQIWEDDTDSVVATFMSSGNVGIGNTNADSKLKVELNPSGTVLAGLRIGYNSTSTNYFDGDTQYFRNGAGTSTAMRIDSSGNLGIGVAPSYKLDVSGNGRFSGFLEMVTGGAVYQGTKFYLDGGGDTFLESPSSNTMTFTTNAIKRLEINSSGHTIISKDLNLDGADSGFYGKTYAQTSTDSTTSIVDTGIVPVHGAVYEVFIVGNMNGGGSNVYRSVISGHLYLATEYNAAVVNEISWQTIGGEGGGSGDTDITVTPKLLHSGTEYTQLPIADMATAQIRLRITPYNASYVGEAQTVRITRRI